MKHQYIGLQKENTCSCGTVGAKIALVLGFLVHDMETNTSS